MAARSPGSSRAPQSVTPPNNVEAEQAVLGGLLMAATAGDDVLLSETVAGLTQESFYHRGHQRIFTGIRDGWAQGLRPDLITLTDRLRQRGELDDAGGAAYVTSLLNAVPTPALLPQYVAIVKRDWLRRAVADLGVEIQHAALNGHQPEELLTLAERMLDGLREFQLPSTPLEKGRGGIESASDLLREQADVSQPWFPLWGQEGLTGPGLVTLVSGHSKVAGKSTSVTTGLRDLHRQHPDLKVLILSEEPRTVMQDRFRRWGLDTDKILLWFADGTPWPTILQRIEAIAPDVLFVDTLRSFAGIVDENDSAKVVAALQPLVLLARRRNIAMIMAHHLRKSEGAEGLSHAGSTALVALSDIALELRVDEAENRRIVRAVSRFDCTPRAFVIEKRGDDILSLGSPNRVRLHEVSQRILPLLPVEGAGLPREEIREALDDPRPSLEQVSRALRLLKDNGRADVTGEGKKGSPYRYHLSEKFHSSTISSIRSGMESVHE